MHCTNTQHFLEGESNSHATPIKATPNSIVLHIYIIKMENTTAFEIKDVLGLANHNICSTIGYGMSAYYIGCSMPPWRVT